MDATFLASRIASIQQGLENETSYLESLRVESDFDEASIQELRSMWEGITARVTGLDNLINLLQETQDWIRQEGVAQ